MKEEINKKLPEIKIKYSPKLDPIFLGYMKYESKHNQRIQESTY